jgi:hypothetical protein
VLSWARAQRRNNLLPSHTTGSYLRSARGWPTPLLHRDQRVVGDLDVFRADLGAALGDVALAQAVLLLRLAAPVQSVQRMHFQLGDPHQVPRAGERLFVLIVVADDVADVLAQGAFDALTELLRALHVDLCHPVFPGLQLPWAGANDGIARAFS